MEKALVTEKDSALAGALATEEGLPVKNSATDKEVLKKESLAIKEPDS